MTTDPIRLTILNEASRLTGGDRNKTYGEPIDNMRHFAGLISAYLGVVVTPGQAAIIMALCKVSRIEASPLHRDNYIDAAAYMAIAGEVNELEKAVKLEDAPNNNYWGAAVFFEVGGGATICILEGRSTTGPMCAYDKLLERWLNVGTHLPKISKCHLLRMDRGCEPYIRTANSLEELLKIAQEEEYRQCQTNHAKKVDRQPAIKS